jgi:hypothetical protein
VHKLFPDELEKNRNRRGDRMREMYAHGPLSNNVLKLIIFVEVKLNLKHKNVNVTGVCQIGNEEAISRQSHFPWP